MGFGRGSQSFFLRNFQSAGVISHRTRRTHSNDRFGTNIRGCSGLRCTNKADGIHALGWCTSWLVHLRQVHPLEGTQKSV